MENTSKGAIIRELIRHGTLTRSEIARVTGLSRSVITLSTIDLMRQGVIQKVGRGNSNGGRRPDEFRLGGGNHLVIGVALEDDLSITSLFTLDGQRIDGNIEPLEPGLDAVEAIRRVAYQIRGLIDRHPSASFLGCSMALPSIADAETDLVTSSGLNWDAVPIRQMLEHKIGLSTSVLDNAHAAALGELWLRGRELRENLVYLYLGRGVGGAIVLDRQIYFGRNHAAGEFGPMLIGGKDEDNGIFFGKLEDLTSQAHLVERMNSIRHAFPASDIPGSIASQDFLSAVAAAAQRNDELALAVIRRAATYAAAGCANLINNLNPDEIIIGGPMAIWGEPFTSAVYEIARLWALALPFASVRILVAKPRQDTIPLGAAAAIIQRASELLTRRPESVQHTGQ